MKLNRHFIGIFLIATLGIAIYANSLNNGFVYDDTIFITNNIYIKNLENLPKLFNMDIFCAKDSPQKVKNAVYYYRPLQAVSNMFDYSLWRLNVFGYHLTNLLWHLLTAILIYFLVNLLFRDLKISLIAGLLFVAHPIHTEAVTYISGRTDLMASSFLLLSFILFIKYRQFSLPKRNYYYAGSVISFIFAILSKETGVILPFILILYDWLFSKQEKNIKFISKLLSRISIFIIIDIIYAGLRFAILNFGEWGLKSGINPYLRILTACKSTLLYIKLLFLPFDLHMDRSMSAATSIFNLPVLISIVLLIIIGVLAVKAYKSNKTIFLSIVWFLVFLFPTLNLVAQLPRGMLEHWVYVPSIGIFIILGFGIAKIFEIPQEVCPSYISNAVFIVILGLYSGLTIKQNTIWKDEPTLYKNMLKYRPDNVEAHYNLGNYYWRKGLLDNAIKEYEGILTLNPGNAGVHNSLGRIYTAKGLVDKAITESKEALRLQPDLAEAHNNLGLAYDTKGLSDEALKEYKEALRLGPTSVETHNNLGTYYAKKKLLDEAIIEYRKALKLNPDDITVMNNLSIAYMEKGDLNSIISESLKLLKSNSRNPDVHTILGNVYLRKGLLDEAIKEYLTTLNLNPDNKIEIHTKLGNAYEAKGFLDNAMSEYKEVLRLAPDSVNIHNNIGNIYGKKGMLDEALKEYKEIIRLKPDYPDAYNNLGNAYYVKGLFEEAAKEYRDALKMKPDYAEAHSNLGAVYLAKDSLNKDSLDVAINEFSIAIKLKPGYLDAHNNLAYAYEKKGLSSKAIEKYKEALRINPNSETARQNLNRLLLKFGVRE
ncbi:MAG: tetratricopeptide repeat protein [bacterium]|nr:tetratricopeptide repeat protein [bacterium]